MALLPPGNPLRAHKSTDNHPLQNGRKHVSGNVMNMMGGRTIYRQCMPRLNEHKL